MTQLRLCSLPQQINLEDLEYTLPKNRRSSPTKAVILVLLLAILLILPYQPEEINLNAANQLSSELTDNQNLTKENDLSVARIGQRAVTITRIDGKILSGKMLAETAEQIELEADEMKLILPKKIVARIVYQMDVQENSHTSSL